MCDHYKLYIAVTSTCIYLVLINVKCYVFQDTVAMPFAIGIYFIITLVLQLESQVM